MAFQVKQRTTWAGPIVCGLAAGLFVAFAVSTALRAESGPGSGSPSLFVVGYLGMALLFVGLGAVAVYACLRPKVISVKADRLLVRRGEKVIAQVPFANVEAITILWAYPNRTPPAGGLVGLAAGAVAAANAKQKPSGVRIRLKDVGDADTFCPARWLKRKTREVMMAWHMEDSYEEVVKEMRAREKAYLKANGLWPPPAAEGGKNPFDFS